MKKLLSVLKTLLVHANLILALMFVVFLILNNRNPHMGFISSKLSLSLLGVFAALSILHCVFRIVEEYRKNE